MPRPFHHHLRRNTQRECIADEGATTGVRTHQFALRRYEVDAFIALVVGFPHRLVDTGQLRQLLQIVVHLLVADDRQYLVPLECHMLVFIEDRPAVIIQLDYEAVGRLDGRNFDMSIFDIAAAQVEDIRMKH